MSSINDIVRKLRENRILNEREDYKSMDHKDLVKMAQDGDQLAVETLISEYDNAISSMASKFFMDSMDREDVKQIATIGFWDAIQSWNGEGSFGAYANIVMKRKLTDELRKDNTGKSQINYQAELDAPVGVDDEGGETTLGASLPSSGISPEEMAIGNIRKRELLKYMRDNLSDTEREAVMMYIKGYKVSEIAEETGMKYKSVENALKRVKDKIAAWQKTRESKKIAEEEPVKFTESEKKMLESVLNTIHAEKLIESARAQMSAAYENYEESQLEEELQDIEEEIQEIEQEMRDTPHSKRDDLEYSLDSLRYKLSAMEEYLTDEQYQKSEELLAQIRHAEEVEYEGEEKSMDPYAEIGMRQSDF